jgi:hypothetical protein
MEDLGLPESVLAPLRRRGLTVEKILGRGAFGTALLCAVKSPGDDDGGGGGGGGGERLVVKAIDISGMSERERAAALGEVAVLRRLRRAAAAAGAT